MKRQISVLAISAALILAALLSPVFAQEKNPDRNSYFGETHIHTSWSVDAWLFGNRVTGPDDPSSTPRVRPSSTRSVMTSRSTRLWTSWVIGLGIACWPTWTALYGMSTYSALATYLGICGERAGLLLWPAIVLHAVLTQFLARVWFRSQEDASD